MWGQLFGNDTLLTVLALILMLHARGYTQSILMQLALARKDELFNGSIIASSSFYTGSFQGCNYFHPWFSTWCHSNVRHAAQTSALAGTRAQSYGIKLTSNASHNHATLPHYTKWKSKIAWHQVSSELAFTANPQTATRRHTGTGD